MVGLVLLTSCKKETSNEDNPPTQNETQNKAKADSFAVFTQGKILQIVDFYAESGVIYNDTTLETETQLFARYVPNWVQQAEMTLHDSKVDIKQGYYKYPYDTTTILHRSYDVTYDDNGVYFIYLTHDYKPLKYTVVEWDATHIKVYVLFKGTRLFTVYKIV